jgi:hypothetical protein
MSSGLGEGGGGLGPRATAVRGGVDLRATVFLLDGRFAAEAVLVGAGLETERRAGDSWGAIVSGSGLGGCSTIGPPGDGAGGGGDAERKVGVGRVGARGAETGGGVGLLGCISRGRFGEGAGPSSSMTL